MTLTLVQGDLNECKFENPLHPITRQADAGASQESLGFDSD